MKLTSYVDYTLSVSAQASISEVAKAASLLMRALHNGFKEIPNTFVLALPAISESPGRRLRVFRVFAPEAGDHEKLFELMKKSPHFESQFYAKFPRTVPADFNGSYAVYYRDRIKSRDASARIRFEKMTSLLAQRSLWIDMYSTSNQNQFRMYISTEQISDLPTDPGQINSYGFSIVGKPVAVPILKY